MLNVIFCGAHWDDLPTFACGCPVLGKVWVITCEDTYEGGHYVDAVFDNEKDAERYCKAREKEYYGWVSMAEMQVGIGVVAEK